MAVRLPSVLQSSSLHPLSSQHFRSLVVTGLAASLFYDAASEILRRSTTFDADTIQSVMMTEANTTRLVSKLSQMRGAALTLGLMSIPGAHSSFIIFLFLSVPAHSSLTCDARHLHSPSWCRQPLPPRSGQRTPYARLANTISASNIPGRNMGR
jgi:hypothetical protein